MNEQNATNVNAGNAATIVEEQINILLAYLERPGVQLQLFVLALVVVMAYLLGIFSHRIMLYQARRRLHGRSEQTRDRILNRLIPAIDQLDWPLFTLLLIYTSIPLLQQRDNATGLLFYSTIFFWILLAYQVGLTLLYATFRRQSVRRYHKSIFAPGFAVFTLWAALSFLNIDEALQIQLGQLFETNITLGNLLGAFMVLYLFLVASWVVQDAMRAGFSRFDSDPGLVNSILTITRYLVMIVGVVITLNTLGFSPATLAAIAGGLSLGAGLGLQRIVGNFVSGIVLLLEQSVRPGDVVIVGTDMGVVQKINIRSTVVNRFDNVDLVIPNENLMTSTVTTYNTALARKRVEVRVGASYGSDPTQVRHVLEEAAAKHGLVLSDPPPAAYFLGFGDSSLDFVLWAWVANNDQRWGTQSDLHYMVARAFKNYGIEIPFPQRDLNIRTTIPDDIESIVAQHEQQAEKRQQSIPNGDMRQSQQGVTEENEP